VVSLVTQLRVGRFHPTLYWTVILATSTAGTTMSDFMNRSAGLGYTRQLGSYVLAAAIPGEQDSHRERVPQIEDVAECLPKPRSTPPRSRNMSRTNTEISRLRIREMKEAVKACVVDCM
jgi:hypothetical protein